MSVELFESVRNRLTTNKKVLGFSDGIGYVVGSVLFFLGSAVLTRSGIPGASTPTPWILSHYLWIAATATVFAGTVSVVARNSDARGVAGYLSLAAFGAAVLHALQWTAWVYVDVKAYTVGAHEALLEPLLHPFGSAHMLMFAVLVGGGVASLAWSHRSSWRTHPLVDASGVVVGVSAVGAASASLLSFAGVRSPLGLATILLIAVNFAWIFVHGTNVLRGESGE